jgi:hypothetical protein
MATSDERERWFHLRVTRSFFSGRLCLGLGQKTNGPRSVESAKRAIGEGKGLTI